MTDFTFTKPRKRWICYNCDAHCVIQKTGLLVPNRCPLEYDLFEKNKPNWKMLKSEVTK